MKIHVKNFHYLRAQLLRKLLILLSLPLMISSCKTTEKQLSEPVPANQDSTVVTPADTTMPNYFNPEIQTDYGVIQISPQYDTTRPVTLYGVQVPVVPKQ
ncbi:MAG: hypothetical protein AB7V36_06810 [Bacteroidales bacterium]